MEIIKIWNRSLCYCSFGSFDKCHRPDYLLVSIIDYFDVHLFTKFVFSVIHSSTRTWETRNQDQEHRSKDQNLENLEILGSLGILDILENTVAQLLSCILCRSKAQQQGPRAKDLGPRIQGP